MLPQQKFDMCARATDEDKHITTHDLLTQLTLNDTTKEIKSFAHISLLTVQMILPLIGEMKNAAHHISSFRKEALTGWYSLIPLTSANSVVDEVAILSLAKPDF